MDTRATILPVDITFPLAAVDTTIVLLMTILLQRRANIECWVPLCFSPCSLISYPVIQSDLVRLVPTPVLDADFVVGLAAARIRLRSCLTYRHGVACADPVGTANSAETKACAVCDRVGLSSPCAA